MQKLDSLEAKIGLNFTNKDLLKEALTHRSYLNEEPTWPLPHNERLEYLGDAVLELVVTEDLFKRFPESSEGQLTVLRASLVNYQMLAQVANDIDLGKYILLSRGESRDKGKAREVILANTFEALVGALYLDQGFEETRTFIENNVLVHLDEILKKRTYKDPKSELQEIIQERLKVTPTYKVLDEKGPAHKKNFRVGVFFGDALVAEGVGSSKQEGEVKAAENALRSITKER